jgi:hypothetical protein
VEDGSDLVKACILRELLALPPSVLAPPIFRKLHGYLDNYRRHFT